MEKKVLLKDLVDGGTNIRKQIISKVWCSDNGVHTIGELWDANKIIDIIVHGAKIYTNLKLVEDKLNWIDRQLPKKQDLLISGENIKTINGQSILGSGDIDIQTQIDSIIQRVSNLETKLNDLKATVDNIVEELETPTEE